MTVRVRVHIILQALFTLLVLLVPLLLLPGKGGDNGAARPEFAFLPTFLFTALQVLFFYCNSYLLYPRLLLEKRIGGYLATVVVMSGVIAGVPVGCFGPGGWALGYSGWGHWVIDTGIGLFVAAVGTCYRFILEVQGAERRERGRLAAELAFLRGQVSPHFMFNCLNSLVALARKRSAELEPALLKMSGLMEYMLYDADEERVPLSSELEYIHNYIELQLLRYGPAIRILLMVEPPGREYFIEPMLLIPMIENAFKHGVGGIDPEIAIRLAVSSRGVLELAVTNGVRGGMARGAKAMGLANLQQRLKLLYPGRHGFSAGLKEDHFEANLQIQLEI